MVFAEDRGEGVGDTSRAGSFLGPPKGCIEKGRRATADLASAVPCYSELCSLQTSTAPLRAFTSSVYRRLSDYRVESEQSHSRSHRHPSYRLPSKRALESLKTGHNVRRGP